MVKNYPKDPGWEQTWDSDPYFPLKPGSFVFLTFTLKNCSSCCFFPQLPDVTLKSSCLCAHLDFSLHAFELVPEHLQGLPTRTWWSPTMCQASCQVLRVGRTYPRGLRGWQESRCRSLQRCEARWRTGAEGRWQAAPSHWSSGCGLSPFTGR